MEQTPTPGSPGVHFSCSNTSSLTLSLSLSDCPMLIKAFQAIYSAKHLISPSRMLMKPIVLYYAFTANK